MRTPKNIERVQDMLQQNSQITFRKLSEDLNISKMACHKFVRKDLGKRKLNTRLAPRSLTQEQKDNHSKICADFLEGNEKSYKIKKLTIPTLL
jgi:DeoR/GlpR family transcriptional regulator of sugar metabolism